LTEALVFKGIDQIRAGCQQTRRESALITGGSRGIGAPIEHTEGLRNPAAVKAGTQAARIIAEWWVVIQEAIHHTKDDATWDRLAKLEGGA
jgi:hypothetical protein